MSKDLTQVEVLRPIRLNFEVIYLIIETYKESTLVIETKPGWHFGNDDTLSSNLASTKEQRNHLKIQNDIFLTKAWMQ